VENVAQRFPRSEAVATDTALPMFQSKSRASARVVVLLVFAALAARLVSFTATYASNVLFFDQWDFYGGLFRGASAIELFLWQHGPHRMGIGGLALGIIANLTAWDTRYDSLTVALVLVLSAACALILTWRLANRARPLDIAVPFLVLNLSQYEHLVVTPNPALAALPLALVLLFALALDITRQGLRYVVLLIINFLAIYTGFGLFLGILTPLILLRDLVRQRSPVRLVVAALAISILSPLSFFIGYRPGESNECLAQGLPSVGTVLQFVSILYGSFAGLGGTVLAYPVAVAVIATTLGLGIGTFRTHDDRVYLPLATLGSFSLLFALGTALGRSCQGPEQAQVSRYFTLLIPGFLATYIALSRIGLPRLRLFALAAIFVPVVAFSLMNAVSLDPSEIVNVKRLWAECYVREQAISSCDRVTGHWIHPDAEWTGLQGKLDYLRDHRLNLFKGT
jgi:hypothetical protein